MERASLTRRAASLLTVLILGACGADDAATVGGAPGAPLPDLGAAETEAFEAGRSVFRKIFSPEEGLGPRFNESSCSACHTFPVDGGTGETAVRKATRQTASGGCDLLSDRGGENLRIQVTPALAEAGGAPVPAPEGATHRARFTIPFLFGLGLVDAIPLEVLESRADPDDVDGDGVSGRLGRDREGRPARFGRKADLASLDDFIDSAFRLEMGITTPDAPDEDRAGAIPPVPAGTDPAPEPEVGRDQFDAVSAFLRFLAPLAPSEDGDDPTVERGSAFFRDIGCAACHVPVLRTGPHEIEALAHKAIALYSDLLLHDMGPELEATCGPGASPTEFRTEPLMGLRYRDVFLHDGRAGRVRDAILLHGGEAEGARRRFAQLHRLDQEAVLRFLGTL